MWKTLYEADCKTGVCLQFVPEVPVCYVQTEHNRLFQVLINLLGQRCKIHRER